MALLFAAAALACAACGSPPPASISTPSAVQAVPPPAKLLAWIMAEVQDSTAEVSPPPPCVTRSSPVFNGPHATSASEAPVSELSMGGSVAKGTKPEPAPTETWRYTDCRNEPGTLALSGERHLWAAQKEAGRTKMHSHFALARTRGDGASWQAEGQTEVSWQGDTGSQVEHQTLAHGSTKLSGSSLDASVEHAYAYHLRSTEGVAGIQMRRLSGVAQLNFGRLGATSQVKLVGCLWAPTCPWPIFGHVSIATTASDGSVRDATLIFTEACGVVKDAQGALTALAMPWEEGT